MTYHHGHGLGWLALVAAIAFVFGPRVARIAVGSVLIAGAVFFLYIMWRVVTDTI